MAPEQLLPGRAIDARADLWAVGCTLYQVLTGKTPFVGNDLVELMYSIQTRPHLALGQVRPGLDDVSALIDDCLAKEPHRRPPSAEALKARIQTLLDAPVVAAPSQEPAPVGRWPWVMAGLVAVASLVVVAATRPWLNDPTVTASPPVAPLVQPPPPPVIASPVAVEQPPNSIAVAELPPQVEPPNPPVAAVDAGRALTRRPHAKPTHATPPEPPPTTNSPPPPESVLDERL